jgi:hypothetical protein
VLLYSASFSLADRLNRAVALAAGAGAATAVSGMVPFVHALVSAHGMHANTRRDSDGHVGTQSSIVWGLHVEVAEGLPTI